MWKKRPYLLFRLLLIGLAAVAVACTGAAGPAPRSVPVPTALPSAPATPAPIAFPRDEAPHHNLTEWWYYTGHLATSEGRRYGFEFVIFQSVRGEGPVGYVAHAAITDHQSRRFTYDQRMHVGSQIGKTDGFDLEVGGWRMRGAHGLDLLQVQLRDYALDLRLVAEKPPALHNRIGYISFGPAGDSYYYSRTRMAVEGELSVGADASRVTGLAWMDHQWGDFISAGGGWDWFAVQLGDGSDLTVSIVRDEGDRNVLAYGMFVDPDGAAQHLDAEDFRVEARNRWQSPRTGAVYPSGWRLQVDPLALNITLDPVLLDQELDTRESTGVVYWEGEVDVRGDHDGRPVEGHGYVELTGYAP